MAEKSSKRLVFRRRTFSVRLYIDMRYVGQGYEVRVPFPMETLTARHIRQMQRAFEDEYRAFYGQLADGVAIEAVNWRVLISGPAPDIESAPQAGAYGGQ